MTCSADSVLAREQGKDSLVMNSLIDGAPTGKPFRPVAT
jgi:hypothetical protein